MNLYINCVSANNIMRCKKDNLDVMQYVTLINPQYMGYDETIMFDMYINLPEDYNINSRFEGNDEYIVIKLSKIGSLELNTKDFRDITIN